MRRSSANRPEGGAGTVARPSGGAQRAALRFILLMGVLSFFADFTYEGARSSIGPYLATLGATATVVGVVTGLGELLGYGLRLVSGRLADSTGQFWPISIVGYLLQMSAVPALALTHDWRSAAALIVLERVGKAVRNPPRDVMLAQAARQVGGYGWTFGLHEALDQFGAMLGPLLVAAVLARQGDYRSAFALLLVPAALNIGLVLLTRWLYPRPQDMENEPGNPEQHNGLPHTYWLYFCAALLVAAGFADYPLMAYHFSRTHSVPTQWIAIFYAVAMGVSGCGSLLFGRLFDRYGFKVLVGLTLASSAFAPLTLLGGFWCALWGAAIWGMGMGVHESIIPAAVAPMVPSTRRASAFGLFTAGYGIAWFAGSSLIGILYDHSLAATVAFCMLSQLAAVPILWYVGQRIGNLAPGDDRYSSPAPP